MNKYEIFGIACLAVVAMEALQINGVVWSGWIPDLTGGSTPAATGA